MANVSELMESFVRTFNESKWQEGQDLWAPNGVLEEVGTGKSTLPPESRKNSDAWRAAFPDAQGVIENRVVAGNQAMGEVVWSGTNRGSLNGMPPTGKKVSVRAVVSITEDGGKIAKGRHYIDIAGMLTQLGVLPTPSSA
jgi:predicted ester cyclase